MFQNLGSLEIVLILVVLMILFGAKKIPEFAKGLGQAGNEFKKGLQGEEEKKKEEIKDKQD